MLDETRQKSQRDMFQNRPSGSSDLAKKIPGAYVIRHQPTGKFYVGSSDDIGRRLTAHVGQLRRGEHHSAELQELYEQDPQFEVQVHPAQSPRDQEQQLLNTLQGDPLLINKATDVRNSFQGLRHTEETRERMSAVASGRTLSETTRQKIAQANRERETVSEETRARMSASHTTREALERRHEILQPRFRSVRINRVVYESTHEAARQLGLSQGCVQYRLNSPHFEEWFYE